MSITETLLKQNRSFAENFSAADLPILPKMRTVILTCVDARVDPAHVLGLALGDAVIIRNNGGRVTKDVIEELSVLAFMVAMMDGDKPGSFELVIMQHTQCGAERFADPGFQGTIKEKLGIDVSASAIADHEQSIKDDIERLRNSSGIPGHIIVSGQIYDVKTGSIQEIVPPSALGSITLV